VLVDDKRQCGSRIRRLVVPTGRNLGEVVSSMREKTLETPSISSSATARSRTRGLVPRVISIYKEVSPSGQAIKNENRRKGIINKFSVNNVKAIGMQKSGQPQLWWAVRV